MSYPGREVDALAQHLLREGHVEAEVDARLAAMKILAAQRERSEEPEPRDRSGRPED